MEQKLASLENKKTSLEAKLEDVRGKYSDSMSEFSKSKVELDNMNQNYANSENILKEKADFGRFEVYSLQEYHRKIKLKNN